MSFGHGPHGCLGAPLAMEEAQITLETLFSRMTELRLDDSREIRWYRNAGNRGPGGCRWSFRSDRSRAL